MASYITRAIPKIHEDIWGSEGDDLFTANLSDQNFFTYHGGLGVDTFSILESNVAEVGFKINLSRGVDNYNNRFESIENVIGGYGDDVIIGSNDDNYLAGKAGDDIIRGLSGNDHLTGGDGDDVLRGNIGNDLLEAGNGDDRLYGGKGNDTLLGGAGNDRLQGHKGIDYVAGGAGDDSVFGGAGDDELSGGSGNDKMNGGKGNDVINADSGDDMIIANFGNDIVNGGSGIDTLNFFRAVNGVNVDVSKSVASGMGEDSIKSIENITGSGFDDHIKGSKGENVLVGSDGDDWLYGYRGADVLTGGDGNDTFYFSDTGSRNVETGEAWVDVITDFSEGDILDLEQAADGSSGSVTDWVMFSEVDDNTIVSARFDTESETFSEVAVLQGVTGLDVNQMYEEGFLIA